MYESNYFDQDQHANTKPHHNFEWAVTPSDRH